MPSAATVDKNAAHVPLINSWNTETNYPVFPLLKSLDAVLFLLMLSYLTSLIKLQQGTEDEGMT